MEAVYKELNDVKAEMERLNAECRVKTELSETLRRSYNEQSIKFQEAKLEIEKHAQQLNVKLEEISQARQISETLQSSLWEKESSLRNLGSLHEKLRADSEKKLQKLETENRELASALDEVTERSKELVQNVCACRKEIEGLKRLLLTTERKCFEAEEKAREAKELRQRDDIIMKLEEENRNAEDQLKWKKEQFKHLEEAHGLLQHQFQLNKEEWERSESALLEEISLLQTNLDSQTRILEGIQKRFEMCNQALAHEESKRKCLEVEVSEFKSHFENVSAKCQQERSKFESLTVQRDEQIAKLRNSLGTKDTLKEEMEIKIVHLEQENQELRDSLKELQEAQIRNAAPTSLIKLRNKLRGLEQVHSNCSTNLKAKESAWSSQIEKMKGDIGRHNSELMGKEKQIQELQMELESCHSTIEVLNEEIAVVHTVFKSEFSEAYSKKFDAKAEMELYDKMDDKISLLTTQLEMKNCELKNAHLELEQEHEKVEILMKRVRSLELTERQHDNMEEEIQQHKKMLEESSAYQLYMKEQFLQMEGEKRDVSEALEKANLELAEKIGKVHQLEYELQKWKSIAENLKICCEEKQEKCRQMENSLLAQAENGETFKHEKASLTIVIKEQDNKIEVLRQQIVLLEATVAAKNEEVEAFTQDKEILIQNAKEKDSCIENLQKDISSLEQESKRREVEAAILARLEAEIAQAENGETFKHEKANLTTVIKEQDNKIEVLQQQIILLEATVAAKNEEVKAFTQDKEIDIQNAKESDSCIQNLQKDLTSLEQESKRREVEAAILARLEAEKYVGQEIERLFKVINEKDQNINNLQVLAVSLEQDLTNALISSFSEVVENLVIINVLTEALEKAKHMTDLEVEEKNKKIVDLEKEVCGSSQRLIHQEEILFNLKQQAEELQAFLKASKLETDKLMDEQRRVEGIVKQLESEKWDLLQDTRKLSKERENILLHIEEFCNCIGEFTCEDVEMMNILETMLQRPKEEVGLAKDLTVDNELSDSTQVNANTSVSASARKIEASSAGRSPLKEVNQQKP